MNNQEQWEIGDIAICIDLSKRINARIPPLRLNREYTVYDIKKCDKCGDVCLDVGIRLFGLDGCHLCGVRTRLINIAWCGSFRFIKKKSMEDSIQEQYEEILNKQLVNE